MGIDLYMTDALERVGDVPKFSIGEVALRDSALQLHIWYPVVKKRDRDVKE